MKLKLLILSFHLLPAEKEVYDAVIKWTRCKTEERKIFLAELFDNVRLPLLSVEDLVSCVENEEVLRSNLHCRDLIDEAKNFQLFQGTTMNPSDRFIIDAERILPRFSYSGLFLFANC